MMEVPGSGRGPAPCGETPGITGLVLELLLRIAACLTWHQACTLWSALPLATSAPSVDKAWASLVAALVDMRGHDEVFLADVSTIQEAALYRPLIKAYSELYPSVIHRALSVRYPPNRMLEHIFATDDALLLRLLIETHCRLSLDGNALSTAIDRRACRCVALLLAEASPNSTAACGTRVHLDLVGSSSKTLAGRKAIEIYNKSQSEASQPSNRSVGMVDFGRFPQRLLWRAAATRDDSIAILVLHHLLEAAKAMAGTADRREAAEAKVRRWAACCGAAYGSVALLRFCGAALADDCSRVSFQASADGSGPFQEDILFEESPIAVVAAEKGHIQALEEMVRSGVDMMMCTSRGVAALDAVRLSMRHSAALRAQLEVVILAPPGSQRASGSRPSSRLSSKAAVGNRGDGDGLALALQAAAAASAAFRLMGGHFEALPPLEAAIKRGDVIGLRSMLRRGAKLEQRDLMTAVNSGDLEMLAIVQAECSAGAGLAEYRRMMKQTSAQIRADRKAFVLPPARHEELSRQSVASLHRPSSSSSSSALRRAGESFLHSPTSGSKLPPI
ncbi:unnamed protein product [Polarella glacialis]|uniref:Uncharacterized protein n=1 Tax=Polarella glacialis TaxID=89957 RepID=A0A813GAB1_POLGL|nr:unnamed protein product [Polarella glacialis]